jgi:NAD(P)-dependent dehydrogenase (short-subunit alcohol dehydrogenase family)
VEVIRDLVPKAHLTVVTIDLADLGSVRDAVAEVRRTVPTLDALVNNAGVMAVPRRLTVDGFEMQLGTNHLGHFALTGALLDHLEASGHARVVNVSSFMHRIGRISFGDLDARRSYRRWLRYGQSKVANLLFTYELQRRLAGSRASTIALAAHPGAAMSELRRDAGAIAQLARPALDAAMQPTAMGALPILRATVDPAAMSGDYFGPHRSGLRGFPIKVRSTSYSRREDVASKLWDVSEQLTGVAYLDDASGRAGEGEHDGRR